MSASLRISPKKNNVLAVVNALCSDEKRRLITATGQASYGPFRVPGIAQIRMKTVSGFVVSACSEEGESDYIFIQNPYGKNAAQLPSSNDTALYLADFTGEYTSAFEEWSVKEVLNNFYNIGNTFERDTITGLMYSVDEASGTYNDLWACDAAMPYDNKSLYYRIA